MIAKKDDRYVTAESLGTMSPAEMKALENRLRAEARRQGFEIGKFVHPFNGALYALSGGRGGKDALTILELRDYLYEAK